MSSVTSYPDVNAILSVLLTDVRAILGDQFVGFYLYGSLASGDFDPGSSDIDFLVVTAGPLPGTTLPALEAMHARIAASGLPYTAKLEGSYIPRAALRRYDPADDCHPTIGVDWPFHVAAHGRRWSIQRYIVREFGTAIAGPPPKTLIDPIAPEELRALVRDTGLDFWSRQLADPAWLQTREYQAFAILTMCRILYTLAHSAIATKPVAAAWARATLDPRWRPLLDRALAWRYDHEPDDMTDMLAFIRYTLARCRQDAERERD